MRNPPSKNSSGSDLIESVRARLFGKFSATSIKSERARWIEKGLRFLKRYPEGNVKGSVGERFLNIGARAVPKNTTYCTWNWKLYPYSLLKVRRRDEVQETQFIDPDTFSINTLPILCCLLDLDG